MADPFKLGDRHRSGALAAAAERLERVANIVKDQQLARTQSGLRQAESEAYVSSPEEAWSRKYMIQCVGPVCTIRPTAEGALLLPRFQPAPPGPAAQPGREIAPQRPGARPAQPPARKAADQPIGAVIGKPMRKRSWLRRLVRP